MNELILIVDDNTKLLTGMKMRLEMVGYQVLVASDGQDALELLKSVTPHLVVADIMMPRLNGWELLERLRNEPRLSGVPVIFVTARSDDESIQKGKSLGVDDYLVKPFKAEELEASIRGRLLRVSQLSRQSKAQANMPLVGPIHTGCLTIDLQAHRVDCQGKIIRLSPIEFNLLSYLLQKAGQVVTFKELGQVSSPGTPETWDNPNSIRVHIKNLRKKIEPEPGHPQHIINVRGLGYRFDL